MTHNHTVEYVPFVVSSEGCEKLRFVVVFNLVKTLAQVERRVPLRTSNSVDNMVNIR